jgi:ferritin-like protein
MTEREIQLLGFEQHIDDAGGEWDTYYYYTYTITRGLEFISNASDEIKEGGEWFIEFFETEIPVRFYKFEEVQTLISMLEKHLIKK